MHCISKKGGLEVEVAGHVMERWEYYVGKG